MLGSGHRLLNFRSRLIGRPQMPHTTPIRDSNKKLQNLTGPELSCGVLLVVTEGSYCIICIKPAGVEYLATLSYSLGTSLLNIA
jgi:hypothetical protein